MSTTSLDKKIRKSETKAKKAAAKADVTPAPKTKKTLDGNDSVFEPMHKYFESKKAIERMTKHVASVVTNWPLAGLEDGIAEAILEPTQTGMHENVVSQLDKFLSVDGNGTWNGMGKHATAFHTLMHALQQLNKQADATNAALIRFHEVIADEESF